MTNVITGYTNIYGIIANPIKHSFSPAMHNTSFQNHKLDCVYVAFEVKDNCLKKAIEGCKVLGVKGLNISMPYKMEIIKYLDGLDTSAKLSKAVNTIVLKDDKYIGYNTDGAGFMLALKEDNIDVINKQIVVLGSGGAALAIIAQAASDGVSKIIIYKRRIDELDFINKIKDIQNHTDARIEIKDSSDKVSLKTDLQASSLLVNCTSVGMHPNVGECLIDDESYLHKDLAVVDIIYNPKETKLLKMAKLKGCKIQNGKPMLLYQGAVAFNLWTNCQMPINKVKKIMEI